ncbi:hypothetical protein ACWCPX_22075 [Streptomyces olivaceoviridis]
MDDASDLDEWLAWLPKPSPREALAELLAAREAAAAAPPPEPTTIPTPDFPYPLGHPLAGTVRFWCPLGCGWYHDERSHLDASAQPLVVPVDPARLAEALTEQANARHAAFQARVERAIADHFEQAHPGR